MYTYFYWIRGIYISYIKEKFLQSHIAYFFLLSSFLTFGYNYNYILFSYFFSHLNILHYFFIILLHFLYVYLFLKNRAFSHKPK